MGGTGATFGQSFVNTLIQGQTIMAQVADRREHLELQKKLAQAQLQEHDVKTQLATRALTAQSDLRSRLQPQEWQGSELSPGGSAPAAPLTNAERMSFSASLDPHAAALEMLAGGNRMSLKDMMTIGNNWVGGQAGATPPAAPTAPPAQAGSAQASEPTAGEPSPTPAPATGPATGLGPTSQLEHSYSVTFDKDGQPKLELKTGEKKISLSLHHQLEQLADGRVQNWQITFNPATGGQKMVPVGVPQLPDAQKAYIQSAIAWGLKPGTGMFDMAIAEQVDAASRYQGQGQTIALNRVREKYMGLAGGVSVKESAVAPDAEARAQEVQQAAAKSGAEARAKTAAAQDAPIGDDAIKYVDRNTLNHPRPDELVKNVQGNAKYVQITPAGQAKLPQYLTTKKSLDDLEDIVMQSPEYWPESTGNAFKDIGRVANATAKFKAKGKTDPRIGVVESLKVTMPGTIKMFGDSGNISEAERAMAESALGLQPSTREQALARISTIREMVSNTVEPMGLPPIPRKPGPKPAPPKADPAQPNFILDLKTGKWMPMKP